MPFGKVIACLFVASVLALLLESLDSKAEKFPTWYKEKDIKFQYWFYLGVKVVILAVALLFALYMGIQISNQ